MAKCLKETSYDKIKSSEVLKEMKSRKIVDDFCTNILTDMKELSCYKRLKEISIMHALCDPLTDDELKAKKKVEIAEIGILTLTIDSSLSELTSKKLKTFEKDLIVDIIEELKNADTTTNASESNSRSSGNLTPKNGKRDSNLRLSAKDKNIDTTTNRSKSNSRSNGSLTPKNRKTKSDLRIGVNNTDTTTNTSEFKSRKNGSLISKNGKVEPNLRISAKDKSTDTTVNMSESNSRSNGKLFPKNQKRGSDLKISAKGKNTDSEKRDYSNFKTFAGLSNEFKAIRRNFMEMNANFLNKGSDSESDISMESVSSVHTSDLSSFDDIISISSEDESGEKKRKRISIDDANKKYFRGNLSDIYQMVSEKGKIPIPEKTATNG